jgi:hypothetical protein
MAGKAFTFSTLISVATMALLATVWLVLTGRSHLLHVLFPVLITINGLKEVLFVASEFRSQRFELSETLGIFSLRLWLCFTRGCIDILGSTTGICHREILSIIR